uniref:Cytochrome c peroxidase n=1 Tax=Candidatus Kentrum sp. TUN TaxID=2126343 RepID=A0A450ZUR9_9GAMM|nr:MAG: cytochrome c peroxidase [Candidatus Kentron sp. TUN]VFK60034.1 MAG: cytochrome c peroxidase [Candidatus Kentron sp. TUN]VFK65875.1 MAG: cytochrome c peroxidase [Candidatus Kentron sp. TUN]
MKTRTHITPLLLSGILAASGATLAKEPIDPIAPVSKKEVNWAQVELGKKLFFDPRLSKSGFISCNSCHNLSMGGTDNLKTSIGHNWHQGPINAPTVLNAGMNFTQFWNGRARDLKEQAGGPIANPGEMASTHALAVQVLASILGYAVEFKQVFGADKIDIDQVTQAIAEFEKTLVTPNSRFDQWLRGNKGIITKQELAGYELFKDSGCTRCHNGPAMGGTSFQKMGVLKPYETENSAQGRFDVTRNESDRFVFKVPVLRNVEMTYPYFHDGEAATLKEAVDTMGKLQVGREFTADENAKIVAFLKTLTGDQPSFPLPILPPSTDKTPQPKPFN